MVLTGSTTLLHRIVDNLHAEFAIKDISELCFSLASMSSGHQLVSISPNSGTPIEEILDCVGMVSCKPVTTPIDAKGKLYALQYLAQTLCLLFIKHVSICTTRMFHIKGC